MTKKAICEIAVKREKGVISNLPLSADRLIIKYLSLFSQITLCELIFLSLLKEKVIGMLKMIKKSGSRFFLLQNTEGVKCIFYF
jgi:hypothetical protein